MYLFFIILGIIGFGGLIFIVGRKVQSISLVDVERHISKTKKIKDAIIASRFKRLLRQKGEKPKEILKGASNKFKGYFEKTVDKLMEIEEKSSKTLNKKVESPKPIKRSKNEEKIKKLLKEVEKIADIDDWKQIEGKYIEIIKIDPKNIEAYQGLGRLYFDKNKANEARQIFEFLLKLGVEDADLYINLANLSWEEDNLDEAKSYYLKALSIDGAKVMARVNLGLIFNELGDKESAMQQFKAALELEPKNPKYLDLLIESALKIGNIELAKQALRNLRAVNPENKKIKEFKKRIEEL